MEYFKNFINDLPNTFNTFCDRYFIKILICVAVVLLFLALKFIICAIAKRIIKKICAKKNSHADRTAAMHGVVLPPLRILTATFALLICTLILQLPQGAHSICIKTVHSLFLLAIFAVLYGLSGYAKYLINRLYEKTDIAPYNLAASYVSVILKVLVVIFGVITILQQWVTNISSLLAGLSIGGVALALAAQDTAANFFGSLTVVFDHPFEIGDYIEIGSVAGTVEKMGFRSTKIRRADQALVIMPNAKMSSEHIVNWTSISKRRVDMRLSVTYDTSTEKIEQFKNGIKQILSAEEMVENNTYLVYFSTYAASSLDITVRYYVTSPSAATMFAVSDAINTKILALSREIDVSFAFPTASVYIEKSE